MKSSLLKNGLYNVVGGAIRIGLAVLTIPILIRLIGIEEYGLWALTSSVVGMVTLAEAGLSLTTTVFVSQDLGKEDTNGLLQTLTVSFGAMLILSTLAALALWFGAESLVSFFPKLTQAQQLTVIKALHIGVMVVWARLLQQVLAGVEQAYQRYDLINILNTGQSVLINLGMLAVTWFKGQTIAMMEWQAVATIVVFLSHLWIVRSLLQGINLRPTLSKEKGFAIAQYSLFTWLTSLGSSLFSRVDRLIVGNLLGAQVLGIYAAITDITTQINIFSALPVQPLLPSLSNLTAQQNIDLPKLQQQIKQGIQINAFIALGLGATFVTLSPLILNLIFSGEITNQYRVTFCIATVIYAIYSINAVGYYILFAISAANTCAIIILTSSLISLVLITLGANMFGLIGAIAGNAGYIATLQLNILGMKQLSVPSFIWIRWLYFPTSWFLLVALVNIFLPIQHEFRILIFFIQSFIILLWFYIINKHNTKKWKQHKS